MFWGVFVVVWGGFGCFGVFWGDSMDRSQKILEKAVIPDTGELQIRRDDRDNSKIFVLISQ